MSKETTEIIFHDKQIKTWITVITWNKIKMGLEFKSMKCPKTPEERKHYCNPKEY
jgi:hypothetical protein